MLLCDLQSKLRRLNTGLYVNTDKRMPNGDLHISGIYLKSLKRRKVRASAASRHEVHSEHQRHLRDVEEGNLDTFIGGVCLEYIPEYDQFSLEDSKMLAPGWRSVAMNLVTRGVCTLERARKVFRSTSLGEQTYDKIGPIARMRWARGEK